MPEPKKGFYYYSGIEKDTENETVRHQKHNRMIVKTVIGLFIIISVLAVTLSSGDMVLGELGLGHPPRGAAFENLYTDIDTSYDPLQTPYKGESVIINSKNDRYTLSPVATYEISAKVVSIRKYNDDMAVSPVDLCSVWGQMADERGISYSQSERYCTYYYGSVPSFGEYYMLTHFANNHIIPANGNVSNAINSISVNDKVILKGFLVDVKNEKGNSWKTSLTRYDSGYGGCEIIYVTRVRIGTKIYE